MRRDLVIAIAATAGLLTSIVRVEPFHTEARFWNPVADRVDADKLAADVHRAVGVWPDTVARCGPTRLYIFFTDPPFGRHGRPTRAERMTDSVASGYTLRAAKAAWTRDQAANVNDTIFVNAMFPETIHTSSGIQPSYHLVESEHWLSVPGMCVFTRDSAWVMKP